MLIRCSLSKLGLFKYDDEEGDWDTDDCSDCSWKTISDSESDDDQDEKDDTAAENDDNERGI